MLEKRATGYGWPRFGHAAEVKSLAQHAGLRQGLRQDGLSKGEETRLLEMAVETHRAARWRIPDDCFSEAHYRRIVNALDWKSSPGYPYNLRAPTNRDLFQTNENGIPSEPRVVEIWEIVQSRLQQLLEGEESADYVRLFVKPEPLKEKKLKAHRYRLIASVSIVDQIIDHMCFDEMNRTMYGAWMEVPSKVGWSPYVGGWKCMPKAQWLAIDKSSWDWTVGLWLIDLVFKLRQRLCANMTPQWKQIAMMRYKILYLHPLFVTSAGVVLRQRNPGVMKSGCVNTIADNSIMQYLLHLRVCLETGEQPGGFMSMGDDTLQQPVNDLRKYLDQLNQYCIVKKADLGNEFAGMLFKGGRVEPLYAGKHAYSILYAKKQVLGDIASAYSLLYHRSCYRNWFRSMFRAASLEVPSEDAIDIIYDGGE